VLAAERPNVYSLSHSIEILQLRQERTVLQQNQSFAPNGASGWLRAWFYKHLVPPGPKYRKTTRPSWDFFVAKNIEGINLDARSFTFYFLLLTFSFHYHA
jgi:hypothetical protein